VLPSGLHPVSSENAREIHFVTRGWTHPFPFGSATKSCSASRGSRLFRDLFITLTMVVDFGLHYIRWSIFDRLQLP
jgi:hypothetical protein